jgi:exonuclease SbcD
MTKVKFIHTADLHLDTPFKGLTGWNSDLASRLKDATFKSFQRIITLCITEQVDFLVIAGDIFDSENRSLAAQLKFFTELQKLATNRIAAYIVCGNHDPLSYWLNTLRLPDTIHRFDSGKVGIKSHKKGGKVIADIHGISFQNSTVTDNLAQKFNPGKEAAPISIALLHGTIGSCGPHETYAPFKLNDILEKSYDYWALGHIHKQQIIRTAHPAIVYPGNPQGRDFGETGAKGCYLIEIESGHEPEMVFIPTQMTRFEEITIPLSNADRLDTIADKIRNSLNTVENYSEQSNYILRLILTGRTALHLQLKKAGEIEQLIALFNEGQLDNEYFSWIDQIVLKTHPDIDLNRVRKRTDFPAEILTTLENIANDRTKIHKIIEQAEKDLITPQLKKEISQLTDTEERTLIESVKWLLLEHLIKDPS